ncbi:MAG: Sec-independent protein translocase protein TatB [Hyphomicrobiaceae bacterium]
MLDIGWWELMVVGMVALIVVGPKELPTLLRTIGRYVGMAKRQADEFRSQFDEALRESEFNELRNEMNEIKSDVTSKLDEAQESINSDLHDAHDWDKDGPIEPAPEFADDEPATSFTMPDGEVVNKRDDGEVDTTDAGETETTKLAAADGASERADDDLTAANDTASPDAPDNPAARDAEAVR